MKVLIINAILYTAEKRRIPKVPTIKDTMIYDFCLAFNELGHDVTLYAADSYKPVNDEEYPFTIIWGKCRLKNVFLPSRLPWMPGLKKFLKENTFDLIISSEVFSTSTFYAYKAYKSRVIAWHEIAKHQAALKQIPSKVWYNFIVKYWMKDLHVVARSEEAKTFIKQYCDSVEDIVIDHGVNLDKFIPCKNKKNYFVVCSQLVKRKRIDGILEKYYRYKRLLQDDMQLFIIGSGDQQDTLQQKMNELGLNDSVVFLGQKSHKELIPVLSQSKALLVNTEKDNSMISIVESIAVGTPVVTTDVPLNASYIKEYKLGIAGEWNETDLINVVEHNSEYVNNCLDYREKLSTREKARQFIHIIKES